MFDHAFVIEIDLNAIDAGGVTLVHQDFIVEPKQRTFLPYEGETVVALDEWNVRYPAVVEAIDEGFLRLQVKLDAAFPSPVSTELTPTANRYDANALLTPEGRTGAATPTQ
jgi:hypothetical protein